MRTLIGSFALVLGLFIAGCAAESSDPVEGAPQLFEQEVDSPSVVSDPAPFAADREALGEKPFAHAATTTEVSLESDDARHLKAKGGR